MKHLSGDRAAFAAAVKAMPNTGLMFSLLDGKDIRPTVLKALRPEAGVRAWGTVDAD